MFCSKCGKENSDSAVVCSNCGNQLQPFSRPAAVGQDGPIGGLGIVCFLFPIVGLVLYLVWKDTTPMKANGAGKAALWGVGVSIALYLLVIIIGVAVGASAY